MIEEVAVVANCEGEFAAVRTEKKSACGSCAAREGCATATMSEALEKEPDLLRALNPIGAKPGDKVVIGIEEAALNKVSMAFYAMPLISMIVCALLGQFISQWADLGLGEPLSALGGLLGLILGFRLLQRFVSRVSGDRSYEVTVLRRADVSTVSFCAK